MTRRSLASSRCQTYSTTSCSGRPVRFEICNIFKLKFLWEIYFLSFKIIRENPVRVHFRREGGGRQLFQRRQQQGRWERQRRRRRQRHQHLIRRRRSTSTESPRPGGVQGLRREIPKTHMQRSPMPSSAYLKENEEIVRLRRSPKKERGEKIETGEDTLILRCDIFLRAEFSPKTREKKRFLKMAKTIYRCSEKK